MKITAYNILKKGANEVISRHFKQSEIDCKCMFSDCTYTIYAIETINKLEKLRMSCGGLPIYITSFFRCQRHNQIIGGKDLSKHKMGLAVDIMPPLGIYLKEFADRARLFFETVIEYKDFIHCHDNPF